MLSKLRLIEPTFWPQRFPNVISNLISLLTLSISPFNNFPPSFDFETLYFIFTMLLWWQFDKIFSINWITLKADLKKKMCQPKKIGLSLSKSDSTFLLKNNFPSKSSLELIAVEFSFILCILSLSVTFWGCKRQDQAFWNFNNFPVLEIFPSNTLCILSILRVWMTGSIKVMQ